MWRYLLYYRGQSSQRQTALIPGHHSTPQLHYNAFGLLQLTAVRKRLPMRTWERDCRE